jgi:hypothetical protein
MLSDEDDHSPSARKDDPFRSAFANLPADPSLRLDSLVTLNGKFRLALVGQLQPVVRALLQETPPPDHQGRRTLAHRLNHMLRESGLAILDPKSGQPSAVVAEPYRLVLQSRAAKDGRRPRSGNIKTLPPLKLVEYTRQEPFLTWQQKTSDEKTDNRGR